MGTKNTRAARLDTTRFPGASAPQPPLANPSNITDRMNGVCTTLAGCRELLEAISNRVSGGGPMGDTKPSCMPPTTNSLSGAIGAAEYHADDLLAQLRELASTVGA